MVATLLFFLPHAVFIYNPCILDIEYQSLTSTPFRSNSACEKEKKRGGGGGGGGSLRCILRVYYAIMVLLCGLEPL